MISLFVNSTDIPQNKYLFRIQISIIKYILMHIEHNCHTSEVESLFHKAGETIYPKYHLPINSSITEISSFGRKKSHQFKKSITGDWLLESLMIS